MSCQQMGGDLLALFPLGALVLLHTQTHTERETTLVFRGLSAGLIGQGTPQSIYTGRPSRRAKNHTIATIIMAVNFVESSLPVRWGAVTDSRRDWHQHHLNLCSLDSIDSGSIRFDSIRPDLIQHDILWGKDV